MMLLRSAVLILLCSMPRSVEGFAPLAAPMLSSSNAIAQNNGRAHVPRMTDADADAASESTASSTSTSTDIKQRTYDYALLFDCDGVILETEELHRRAYNKVFAEFGVTKVCGNTLREPVEWSVGYYDILQNSIGGGKPKMRQHFSQALLFESNEYGDPTVLEVTKNFLPTTTSSSTTTDNGHDDSSNNDSNGDGASDDDANKKKKGRKTRSEREAADIDNATNDAVVVTTIAANEVKTTLECLIDVLQDRKTELYKQTVQESAVARPGLLELMDSALADPTIGVGVCSASTKEAAQKVLECTLGPDRVAKLDVCILGDDVSEKKPSPMIYNAARDQLSSLPATSCVVVEDSSVGLKAAKAAGMRCIITYTESTAAEDFYGKGADAKVPDLANNGNPVTLAAIFGPLKERYGGAGDNDNNDNDSMLPELLVGIKDGAHVDEDDDEEVEQDNYDTHDEEVVAEFDDDVIELQNAMPLPPVAVQFPEASTPPTEAEVETGTSESVEEEEEEEVVNVVADEGENDEPIDAGDEVVEEDNEVEEEVVDIVDDEPTNDEEVEVDNGDEEEVMDAVDDEPIDVEDREVEKDEDDEEEDDKDEVVDVVDIEAKEIDDLVVDEAAAATEPEIYIPFQYLPRRLLCVGDPKRRKTLSFIPFEVRVQLRTASYTNIHSVSLQRYSYGTVAQPFTTVHGHEGFRTVRRPIPYEVIARIHRSISL